MAFLDEDGWILRIRLWTSSLLAAALCGSALMVPGAVAGPTRTTKPSAPLKMLPRVGCQGLLTPEDFPGTVTETTAAGGVFAPNEEGRDGGGAFVTTCQFDPPEPSEADPEPSKEVGVAVLGVEPRLDFESRGRRRDLLLDIPSSSGIVRHQLHGIGTRAFFEVTEDGGALGYLQVRNDIFSVAKDDAGGIRSILATVASELCRSCNEAEVPKSGMHG